MVRKSGKGKILPSVQLQSNPIIGSLTPWDRKVKGSWSWRGESWNGNALTIDISLQVVVLIVKEYIFFQMSLNQISSWIHLINNYKISSKNVVFKEYYSLRMDFLWEKWSILLIFIKKLSGVMFSINIVFKVYCNLQMENNLLYFSLGSAVSLATNGVEVGEQQNEQSLNNKMLKSGDI